jgi:hypothetical protein
MFLLDSGTSLDCASASAPSMSISNLHHKLKSEDRIQINAYCLAKTETFGDRHCNLLTAHSGMCMPLLLVMVDMVLTWFSTLVQKLARSKPAAAAAGHRECILL